MKSVVIIIVCIFLANFAIPAGSKTDSLENALKLSKKDTNRVNILVSLSYAYYNSDPEKTIKLGDEALALSKKLNFSRRNVDIYNNQAIGYYMTGQFEKALKLFTEALVCSEKSGDRKGVARMKNNIGNVYWAMENIDFAIENYSEALSEYKKIGSENDIAMAFANISNIYNQLDSLETAMSYVDSAISICEKSDIKLTLGNAYNSKANILLNQKMFDEAIQFYILSLEIKKEIGNIDGAANTTYNIAKVYFDLEKLDQSEKYSLEAIELARKSDSRKLQQYCFNNLAFIEKKRGNFNKAFEFLNYSTMLKDSIFHDDLTMQIADLKNKYESDKKEQLILQQKTENEKQKLQLDKEKMIRIIFIAGISAFIVLIFIVYRNYRKKKKLNIILGRQKEEIETQRDQLEIRNQEIMQAKEEIETQRDEIESHLKISEENRELISHQKKELTDSINYAQRIQIAILPPDYYVKKCFNESFILYMPKDVVSGDFYYVEKMDDFVIFAAVDCTGHGVPGSMMSVIGYNLINQAVKLNRINKPSEILGFLDAGVTETLRQAGGESGVNDGMDIAVCALNMKSHMLQFAGAYNGLVYVSKGELVEIKGENLAIGVNYDGIADQYTNHVIQMDPGDCIYLYSDGYADQFGGPKGKKFKYKPLKELLFTNAALPVSDQKQILASTFLKWKGSLEQVDDILVMGVKV